MYNNSAQYPGQSYQTAYPQYQANYNSNYGAYQGYETAQQYVNPGAASAATGAGENYPQNSWSTVGAYGNQQSTNQPTDIRKEAVAQEMKQQKEQLVKQREDYVKKSAVLRRELDQLRNQKQDLLSDGSTDRDIELILKENDKLQEEIQGKLKAINNVIEMLSSIIKDGRNVSELEASFADEHSKKVGRKDAVGGGGVEVDDGSKYCYIHYDTGMHWCRICDEFPETAKEFLFHLQSKRHLEKVKENDLGDNSPWHKLPQEPLLPSYDNAPKKRIPIKGLQFFISAPSWYCKLCDIWIGDLHCASHHLKSQTHSQNYDIFIQQNPQWEVDWYKDREKAMSRSTKRDSSDSDDSDKKKKKRREKEKRHSESSNRDKKKRKKTKKRKKHSSDSSSSSSSSDSSSDDDTGDKTKSIRVAMRNIKAQNPIGDDLQDKWHVLERLVEEHKEKEKEKVKEKERFIPKQDDTLINQWMTVSEPPDDDKLMLDNLRSRMKQKQKVEDAKVAEMERKRLEKERQEREMFERKQREAKEAHEAAEREKKRREQEELDRIRDKERSQVKFKPNRDGYRQRRTSKSDDEDDRPNNRYNHRDRTRSRSRSSERRSSDKRKHSSSSSSSNKKLPFIGRMPLFKNKKVEEKEKDHKEIKKEEYEPQRKTRFQPGNLARAFIPQPDVVCFPKLSSYPPLSAPPPPPMTEKPPKAPAPPKIKEKEKTPPKEPEVPPAPLIGHEEPSVGVAPSAHEQPAVDPNTIYHMNQYYTDYSMYNYSMYGDYQQQQVQEVAQQPEEAMVAPPPPDMSHTMPLQPPPLPPSEPEDDLALLGICADDMAAQTF